MQLKNYIALLFAVVFFGKLLMVDTNLFLILEKTEDITFLKPFCKKNKAGGEDKAMFTEAAMASSLTMDLLCQVPFDLKISEWPAPISNMNFREYAYIDPGQLSTPREKFYPPPKA